MIVLEQNDAIIHYTVNPNYFDKYKDLSGSSTSASSHWRTAEENTAIYTHKLTLSASDSQSGEIFIEFKSRCVLRAKMEDDEKDALQMEAIIKGLYQSMLTFIENNSLNHYAKLKIPEYRLTPESHQRMKVQIAELRKMKPFEEKSEIEKKFAEQIANEFKNIKTIVHINTREV